MPVFTIVDRYFIRKFVGTTLLCFLILILLLMALDFVMNTDSISELFRDDQANAFKTLGMYYTVWFLNLLQYMDVLLVFCGCVFTFYMLERNSTTTTRGGEIIPMLTSGFPRWRVALPFMCTGVVMFFLLMAVEEGFFPYCADWPGAKGPASLTVKKEVTLEKKVRDLNTGIVVSANKLNVEENKLEKPRLGVPREIAVDAPIELLVFAETAIWLSADAQQNRPAGFMLQEVQDYDKVLEFLTLSDWNTTLEFPQTVTTESRNTENQAAENQAMGITSPEDQTAGNQVTEPQAAGNPTAGNQAFEHETPTTSTAGNAAAEQTTKDGSASSPEQSTIIDSSALNPGSSGQPQFRVFYTSHSTPWVKPGDLFVALNVTLEKLQELDTAIVPESLLHLYRRIHNDPLSVQTSDRIQFHSRLLKPLLNSALLFLTIPVILTARLRNKIVITLLLLLLLCAFKGGLIYCNALGEDGTLPPFMVVWTPILMFYGLAAVLFEELYT